MIKWNGSGSELLSANVLVAQDTYDLNTRWKASIEDESFATAEVFSYSESGEDAFVLVHYKNTGTGILVLTDEEGNTHRIQLTLDEDKNIGEKLLD